MINLTFLFSFKLWKLVKIILSDDIIEWRKKKIEAGTGFFPYSSWNRTNLLLNPTTFFRCFVMLKPLAAFMPFLFFADIISICLYRYIHLFLYPFTYLYFYSPRAKNPFEPGYQSEPFICTCFLETLHAHNNLINYMDWWITTVNECHMLQEASWSSPSSPVEVWTPPDCVVSEMFLSLLISKILQGVWPQDITHRSISGWFFESV